jgi:hypothetical protein
MNSTRAVVLGATNPVSRSTSPSRFGTVRPGFKIPSPDQFLN